MNSHTAKEKRIAFTNKHPQGKDYKNAPMFYQAIADQFNFNSLQADNYVLIVVAHKVSSLPYFLEALTAIGKIISIIPKESRSIPEIEKTILDLYREYIAKDLTKKVLREDSIKTEAFFKNIINENPRKEVVIFDHGGYFAPQIEILQKYKDNIALICEHTWNGAIRYKEFNIERTQLKLISVARSWIKSKEDVHVADSIINALAGIVNTDRGINQSLQNISIGIIGYGQIGSAVAKKLLQVIGNENKENIWIFDTSEEVRKRAEFFFPAKRIASDITAKISDLDSIITATSTIALTSEHMKFIKNEACIICATSKDDQIAEDVFQEYKKVEEQDIHPIQSVQEEQKDTPTSPPQVITKYRNNTGKTIYLAADGGSVNFLIGSTPHPILHAIFAAICVAAFRCLSRNQPSNITPLTAASQTNLSLEVSDAKLEILQEISPNDTQEIVSIYEKFYGHIDETTENFGLYPLQINFCGRGRELIEIRNKLIEYNEVVITGPGGIGKSTTVTQYAMNAIDYNYKIRFNANDEYTLFADFVLFSQSAGINFNPKMDTKAAIIQKVYLLLQNYLKVLIIFENAPNYQSLSRASINNEIINFLPPENNQRIHIIITTRIDNIIIDENKIIRIGQLEVEASKNYIKHYLPEASDADAEELAMALSYFPLALCQAIAYVIENKAELMNNNSQIKPPYKSAIRAYIALFQGENQYHKRELLDAKPMPEADYSDTVYTTWNISMAAIKKHNSLSETLFHIMAYFADGPIPLKIFVSNLILFPVNPLKITEAIEQLKKYSMLDIHTETNINSSRAFPIKNSVDNENKIDATNHPQQTIRVHELIKEVMRNKQGRETRYVDIALELAFTYSRDFTDRGSFIPHCLKIIHHHENSNASKMRDKKIPLLCKIGSSQLYASYQAEQALNSFELANNIAHRNPPMDKYNIQICLGLANAGSGAGNPQVYVKMIDHLVTEVNVNDAELQELLKIYKINLSIEIVKSKIESTRNLPFITEFHIAEFLFEIGAHDLAIVYLIYKKDFINAEIFASKYYDILYQAQNNMNDFYVQSKQVGSICLLIKTYILSGDFAISDVAQLLESAKDLLENNSQIDPFWDCSLYFMEGVIHAMHKNHEKSNETIFKLWDKIMKRGINSLKARLLTIYSLLEFLSHDNENGLEFNNKSLFFAHAYRILGHLFSLFSQFKNCQDNTHFEIAENCFQKSLDKYDNLCQLTYYQLGLLYNQHNYKDLALLAFQIVVSLARHHSDTFYIHALNEKPLLPINLQEIFFVPDNAPLEDRSLNLSLFAISFCFILLTNKPIFDNEIRFAAARRLNYLEVMKNKTKHPQVIALYNLFNKISQERLKLKTADEMIRQLCLEQHPRRWGFFRETNREEAIVTLLKGDKLVTRNLSTCAIALLQGDKIYPLQRTSSTQIIHYYPGGNSSLIVHELDEKMGIRKSTRMPEDTIQLIIPSMKWFAFGLVKKDIHAFAILGYTASPGFDKEDYEDADKEILINKCPQFTTFITDFTSIFTQSKLSSEQKAIENCPGVNQPLNNSQPASSNLKSAKPIITTHLTTQIVSASNSSLFRPSNKGKQEILSVQTQAQNYETSIEEKSTNTSESTKSHGFVS